MYATASKNKCFVSHQKKKIKKGEGGRCFFLFFFNTEKMKLDCAYNEWTETI